MDAQSAGQAARTLDLIHGMSYFAPEANEALVVAGLHPGRMCYFAARSAAMGAVTGAVVAATFYNFNPQLVAKYIPAAWSLASPVQIVAARYRGVDAALRRLLGRDLLDSADLVEASELAATAARAIPAADGRPLYAAHAETSWPTAPHLVLWHALTLLREYRGDGHVAALQTAGLSGVEALVSHTATGAGFQEEFARTRRGWSEEQWAHARDRLSTRGLLAGSGELTAAGLALRERVEAVTDELSFAPWAALGADGAARLLEVGTAIRARIVAEGTFPADMFGPGVRV
ncbi:hypothetical protein FK531_21585 [Rhodococcus spelaei]|uniref:SalK n=1 Tax=Rhodococcus spelaei TaxID=2546320 RepID=A0A541AZF6_9NOCA|nr:hypothetical protein [Rhodococcus spelaei]TQF65461.1 hypothetical protein FK531_21585 [Rhodococcus spelaei]